MLLTVVDFDVARPDEFDFVFSRLRADCYNQCMKKLSFRDRHRFLVLFSTLAAGDFYREIELLIVKPTRQVVT